MRFSGATSRRSRLAWPLGLGVAVMIGMGSLVGCEDDPVGTDSLPQAPRLSHKPGHGGGGGGGPTEPLFATVTIETSIAGAGLYSDGQGSYTGELDGNLWIHAQCPREFRLNLSGEGLVPPFDQVIEDCGFPPRLTIEQGLLGATAGAVLGTSVPPGSTNMSPATNYYFEDGQIGTHNVIWQAGICVTERTDVVNGNGSTTTTWKLSTDPDLLDPDLIGTACDDGVNRAAAADLVTRAVQGRPRTEPVCRVGEVPGDPLSNPACDGSVVAHLDLTVVVTQ